MNISNIQCICIGCGSYRFACDKYVGSTIYVDNEEQIRDIKYPFLLIIKAPIQFDSSFVFELDKTMYYWEKHIDDVDSIVFDYNSSISYKKHEENVLFWDLLTALQSNVYLLKTSKWGMSPIKQGFVRTRMSLDTILIQHHVQPKICVFMSDNRPLAPTLAESKYNSQTAAINYAYCLKHKYDFIYYRPYLDSKESYSLYNCIDPNTYSELRHAAWSKLLSTIDIFKSSYEYFVYIDSDCIFKDFDTRIETFFKLDHNIIFLNNLPWDDDKPCSGFYICKNNKVTQQYIHEWYNYNLPDHNNVHPYEQYALWKIFEKWDSCKLINSWMFIEHPQQFLRHICHIEGDLRNTYFKQFMLNKGINYESLVSQIPYKELNTRTFE